MFDAGIGWTLMMMILMVILADSLMFRYDVMQRLRQEAKLKVQPDRDQRHVASTTGKAA